MHNGRPPLGPAGALGMLGGAGAGTGGAAPSVPAQAQAQGQMAALLAAAGRMGAANMPSTMAAAQQQAQGQQAQQLWLMQQAQQAAAAQQQQVLAAAAAGRAVSSRVVGVGTCGRRRALRSWWPATCCLQGFVPSSTPFVHARLALLLLVTTLASTFNAHTVPRLMRLAGVPLAAPHGTGQAHWLHLIPARHPVAPVPPPKRPCAHAGCRCCASRCAASARAAATAPAAAAAARQGAAWLGPGPGAEGGRGRPAGGAAKGGAGARGCSAASAQQRSGGGGQRAAAAGQARPPARPHDHSLAQCLCAWPPRLTSPAAAACGVVSVCRCSAHLVLFLAGQGQGSERENACVRA